MEISFLDKEFTLWLNGFNNSFFDVFFYVATQTITWIPLFIALLWLIFKRQGGQGLVTVIFVAIVVLLADQISSTLIKNLVARYRPSHDEFLQYMIHTVNGYRGGRYGFVSSHAANCFAVASFLAFIVRSRALNFAMFSWVLINCYSRIYLGVHFVGDILGGLLVGIIVAKVVYELYLRASLHFFVINHHNKWTLKLGLSNMFGHSDPSIVSTVFWVTVSVLFIVTYIVLKFDGIAG